MATLGPDARGRADQVVVALRGELDLVSAPTAVVLLAAAAIRGQSVVVDLAELDFLDCSAVRSLLEARVVAREAGGDVMFANLRGSVLRMLTLLGLADVPAEAVVAERMEISSRGQSDPSDEPSRRMAS